MSSLLQLYRRWRHTRGFGVHSPFAYRLVTEAIRPSRGYVYHQELHPGMTPLKRIAYRIGIFMRNEVGRPPISDLDCWLKDPTIPLLITAEGTPVSEEIRNQIEQRLRQDGKGLLLTSRRYLLAISRPEMAYVSYALL